jgi:hypothetical protein
MENLVINTAVLYKLGFVQRSKDDNISPWNWIFHDGYNEAPYGVNEVPGSEKEDSYLARHYLDEANTQIITLYDLYCSMNVHNKYLLHILEDRIDQERMGVWLSAEQDMADQIRKCFGISSKVMPATIRQLCSLNQLF